MNPLKAIFIDDDGEQAYLVARILGKIREYDVDLVHYSHSVKAMADLLSREWDLVFLDHELSEEQTGLDLLRGLRDFGFDGAIIMLTGRDDKPLLDDFRRYGADVYVNKNELGPERLRDAIQVALGLPHRLIGRIVKQPEAQ